jgi:hypothetical protein
LVVVHREAGFRFIIYKDDHPPSHVHVIKDGEVVIRLIGPNGQPELLKVQGSMNADVRKAMKIVVEQRDLLLARWQEIHIGTD